MDVVVHEWRRIRLFRAFLVLMVPVTFLSVTSYLLWRAIAQSTPDTYPDIQFWFYFFDVGREINVPTWFSAGLWIVIGLITGYYARHAAQFRLSWGFFSFLAIFLSLDETLELHERLDVIGSELARYIPFTIGFTWVIPGVLIATVLCALLLRLVLSLPRPALLGLVTAGLVFVGGSVGAETLSGIVMADEGFAPSFFVLTLVEETLEMTGLALCVATLLHLLQHKPVEDGIAYRLAATKSPTPASPPTTSRRDAPRDAGAEHVRESPTQEPDTNAAGEAPTVR
ncbi:hypothetical protein CI784_10500 [Arthrobacter agilis]|uniref:hypothetical protein n=1 Tax=Arthrobacter agilis TaxID=37921 RepID=UPI000B359875|nr:hypothetical protein [Arthrobacter agilis]OUM42151.1 hypothetical protein B8W74_08510 [Arthrobacter agilis]PPB45496.1 hypothetical protein CI784_10500 [Arthrobacter agilis]VDR33559.1 Uncharacterised protein [Arthrobacter agilis]